MLLEEFQGLLLESGVVGKEVGTGEAGGAQLPDHTGRGTGPGMREALLGDVAERGVGQVVLVPAAGPRVGAGGARAAAFAEVRLDQLLQRGRPACLVGPQTSVAHECERRRTCGHLVGHGQHRRPVHPVERPAAGDQIRSLAGPLRPVGVGFARECRGRGRAEDGTEVRHRLGEHPLVDVYEVDVGQPGHDCQQRAGYLSCPGAEVDGDLWIRPGPLVASLGPHLSQVGSERERGQDGGAGPPDRAVCGPRRTVMGACGSASRWASPTLDSSTCTWIWLAIGPIRCGVSPQITGLSLVEPHVHLSRIRGLFDAGHKE